MCEGGANVQQLTRSSANAVLTAETYSEQRNASIPPGPPQGSVNAKPMNMAVTTDGMATFRAVSDYVYDDPDKWQTLIDVNKKEFQNYNSDRGVEEAIPPYQLVIARLELGTRVAY